MTTPSDRTSRRRTAASFRLAALVLLVGLAATAALTAISAALYSRNEGRLLRLRARDVATVLTAAVPSIQTPLASAAALADASNGDPAKFRGLIAPYVGSGAGRPFVSVSLWRVGRPALGPVAVVGLAPRLQPGGPRTARFLARTSTLRTFNVIGFLHSAPPRLGFGFTGRVRGPYAAYGETAIAPGRYSPPQSNSAFSDLDFALYLGPTQQRRNLLLASVHKLPLSGRRAHVTVPIGNRVLSVEVAAHGALAGTLPRILPWLIAVIGSLLSMGAASLTGRLTQRRRSVERLAVDLERSADENRRLYSEQRGIAQTLQHSLLPTSLPQPAGLQTSARYEAGVSGMEIGGDWFDLIQIDANRLLLVVGDVSGRGLKAATTMASLRYAIHAYAAEGDDPGTLLGKLSRLLSIDDDGQLATVLCAAIDVAAREVRLTSAGHLPLLMISGGRAEYVHAPVGLPVGVDDEASYASTTLSVPAGCTLLAFTDGLVERRGESIDTGLERLRMQAETQQGDLDELLSHVLEAMRGSAATDDTAIAGVRWTS